MAVNRGFAKIPLYRGDYEPFVFTFFSDSAQTTPLDIADIYDEVVLEIRTKPNDQGDLIKRVSLGDGIEILEVNKLQFDLANTAKGATYFYDMRFRIKETNNWLTLISGTAPSTNNISRIDNVTPNE